MEQAQLEAVGKMQEYIESHIDEEITLYSLSRVVHYSPWHCERIFQKYLHMSPFTYIRKRRLTLAAMRLRDESIKVIDVALDFVFDSHEGFTRAFSKQFGLSPKQYQTKTPPLRLFMPYNIRHQYQYIVKERKTMKETNTIFVQAIERPKRAAIIKRGVKASHYFEYCDEVGCDVWGILCSIKDALYEPIGMWLPKKMIVEGSSEYVQGVEVSLDYEGDIPEGFEMITLEPCMMLIFQGPPYKDEDFMDAIRTFNQATKNYDPAIYGYAWADDEAPSFQLEPLGYRGYIEGRPVKKLS